MGERGPLPKPARRRRNRPTTISRGAIRVARPARPNDLAGEARAEWDRIVPLLERMGVLCRLDRATLIRYCTLTADFVELDALLRKTGLLVRAGYRPGLAPNPLWGMRSDVLGHLLELSRQLLLTPTVRIRGGIEHVQPDAEDARERRAELRSIDEYKARLGATNDA
jgi:P27 family predicted phage terminase small subunit